MPKGLPWFRLYAEFAFDPKIQSLPETLQRRFVILMCLKCNGNIPGLDNETAACAMRISPDELQITKKKFIEIGLISDDYEITKWSERQYSSDSSTNRVHKFRNKKSETFQKRFRNRNVTPLSVSVSESKSVSLFASFWKEYPKKANKGQAEKTWNKIKPNKELVDKMIVALSWQKKRKAWTKDNGEFCPHPSTWLNAKGWEDEKPICKDNFGREIKEYTQDDKLENLREFIAVREDLIKSGGKLDEPSIAALDRAREELKELENEENK